MNMAFLSSFRAGRDTAYPEALRERLRTFPLMEAVNDAALHRLLSEANWFGLPGGVLLDRDGENDQALFLVVTGSLGVFVDDEQGGRRLVAHIPAGETVGEMSLISGDPHSAQLIALRDTELLRVSASAFDALIARHPRIMLNLMRVLVRRLQEDSVAVKNITGLSGAAVGAAVGMLVQGLGWGLVETVINPLTSALYPEDRVSRLFSVAYSGFSIS